MHGPTGRAGSVASVRRIKNVARLAQTVMQKTNHVMIVGDGARRFAVAEGFEEKNLLTDNSRKIWLAWKASSSFNWRPGIDSPEWKEHISSLFDGDPEKIAFAERVIAHPPTGTIPCMAVDEKGDISATTTTSGPRVENSWTRRRFADHRRGMLRRQRSWRRRLDRQGRRKHQDLRRPHHHRNDAQRHVADRTPAWKRMHRVAHNYKNDKKKLSTFHIFFYALNKDGVHGAASLWNNTYSNKPATYAVHDGTEAKLAKCAPLFDETHIED